MNDTVYIDYPPTSRSTPSGEAFGGGISPHEAAISYSVVFSLCAAALLVAFFLVLRWFKKEEGESFRWGLGWSVATVLMLAGAGFFVAGAVDSARDAEGADRMSASARASAARDAAWESGVTAAWPEYAAAILRTRDTNSDARFNGEYKVQGHPGCTLYVSNPVDKNQWAGLLQCPEGVIAPRPRKNRPISERTRNQRSHNDTNAIQDRGTQGDWDETRRKKDIMTDPVLEAVEQADDGTQVSPHGFAAYAVEIALARIRELHKPLPDPARISSLVLCTTCRVTDHWPCATARLCYTSEELSR